MNWTCQYCQEEMLSDHRARHIQRKHPEHFKPQSNKGDSMCPSCLKIMHKTHVKRHMILMHKADQNISIRQMKKQIVETNCSIEDNSNQGKLSVPLYWMLTFMVLDKLWKEQKYVEISDVISSMFKFLKIIDLKHVGDCREYLQCLSSYSYIEFAKTITTTGQEERQITIKHIIKGKMYSKLLQQILSNVGTRRFLRICHRMSFTRSVMRFNREQFADSERSNSQSQSFQESNHFEFLDDRIQYSVHEEVEQKCFASTFSQIDHEVWQFKKKFDQYCFSGRRDQSFLKKLDNFDKKQEFSLILKNCHACNQAFTPNDLKIAKCIYCSTELHEQCSQSLQRCDCQSKKFQLKREFKEKLIQQEYKTPLVSQNHLLKRSSFQGISVFKSQTSQAIINAEEEVIKNALFKRDQFIYSANAKISNSFKVTIDLKYDPLLFQADKELAKAYQLYVSGSYKPPLKLKTHSEDNFGIEALETLPRLILLGEYAADIIPSVYCSQVKWKDHLMIYYQGATSIHELMLVPFSISNFGPLLNHSDQGNCSSLRIIINGTIRVLLFTLKKIQKGEELLYNYNGFHHDYPTDGFRM